MNAEAREDIMDDTILDEAHDCQDCANSRLILRQQEELYKRQMLINSLREELEAERGRNRVLGFQIRTLREGK